MMSGLALKSYQGRLGADPREAGRSEPRSAAIDALFVERPRLRSSRGPAWRLTGASARVEKMVSVSCRRRIFTIGH
jgi:hypothetical protein